MTVIGATGPHAVNLCLGPINLACSAASSVVGGATSAAETGLLTVVATAIGDAATAVVDAMLAALNATTEVDFSAAWFSAQTQVMATLVLPVVMALFLIQIIGSVLRREPGGLARAGLGLGKALIAGAAAIPILQLTLAACDEMCNAVIGASTDGIAGLAQRLFAVGAANLAGGPVLVGILDLWAIVTAFLLWGVLLFRKALLLVTGAFTMVAFAGSSWDATRGWVRKWVETAAALAFSKLVIVVVLVTGINALGLSGTSGEAAGATVSDVFAGLLLLSIATLAPWLCWQFVHWGGGEIAHGMHQTMARSPLPQALKKGGQAARFAAGTAAGGPAGAGAAFRTNGTGGSATTARAAATSAPPRPPASPSSGSAPSARQVAQPARITNPGDGTR